MPFHGAQLKTFALASLTIAAVCCGRTETSVDATTSTSTSSATSRQATPKASVPPKDREIYIDSVSSTNPLVVKGRARTFENSVSLRVRDENGKLITEGHVTSVGEMGHHNPFEATLWIVRDPGRRVTAEAFEYSARDGSVQSLTRKSVPYAVEMLSAKLMFPVGDCTNLRPFTRRLPKSIAMARLLSEALVAGATDDEKAAGATSPFPEGSEVRSVILRGGEVTVDFNERLQNVGGSCAALAIRQSVVQTLKQLPTVKQVRITAGGSEALALQP